MAWTAYRYFDPEKGASYPLEAPVFAENKETAERYDRFLAPSGRYYLWDVADAGGGTSEPVAEWADTRPEPDRPGWPAENPPTIFGSRGNGTAAPVGQVPVAPVRGSGIASPVGQVPVKGGLDLFPVAGPPVVAPPANPGPIFGSPLAESFWPFSAPPANPGPITGIPEGPRIVDFTPIGQTPTPPVGYQPVETFPIPEPTRPSVPILGARPTEFFPKAPEAPVLFWTKIADDGYTRNQEPTPAPVDLGPVLVDNRNGLSQETRDVLWDLFQVASAPVPQSPYTVPEPEPEIPRLTWPYLRVPERPAGPDPEPRRVTLSGPINVEPVPTPRPIINSPTPDPMPTNRYSLAGSPEPGETTEITDTNALLKQALDTVGQLANIFVPQQSTAPAPTAAPVPQKPKSWWEAVPQWAWLLVGAGVVFTVVNRK